MGNQLDYAVPPPYSSTAMIGSGGMTGYQEAIHPERKLAYKRLDGIIGEIRVCGGSVHLARLLVAEGLKARFACSWMRV